jgi:hypothetical protein
VTEPKKPSNPETSDLRPSVSNNLNEFHTKYTQFEQKQLEKLHSTSNKKQVALKSASTREVTFDEPPVRRRKPSVPESPNLKSSIISNLIERGLRLKSEMSKSTSNLSAKVHRSLEMYNTVSNYDNYSFLDETKMTNDTSFCNLNDVSRLSDPLHDPNMLSALIYSHHYGKDEQGVNESINMSQFDTTVDDPELRELLAPTDLFTRLNKQPSTNNTSSLNAHDLIQEKPVKLTNEDITRSKTSLNGRRSRVRSVSRSSMSSNCSDDDDLAIIDCRSSRNPNRVSFEIQSSDGETSGLNNSSSNLNERCIDTLSPQRISLLNLVQIAKLKINKMSFFTISNIQSLIDRVTANSASSVNNQKKSINSKTKPPLATKKLDLAGQFFIEYQFPVVANGDQQNNSVMMATQVMRVNAKRVTSTENGSTNSDGGDCVVFEHEADYSVLFNSNSLETWWRSGIVFKIYCRASSAPNSSGANLAGSSGAPPCLIGMARLSLKNALRSKNFKLYKKLAINDQLNTNR